MITLFTSARLKLTVFYVLTFLTLSFVVSGLFYYRTAHILEMEYGRIEQRLQLEIQGINLPGPRLSIRRIQPEDLDQAKRQIVTQLLRINGMITIVVAIAGYILSGLTLRPIERSMEEQRRFVGDAAHELKTPITALKTSLEVSLMDEQLDQSTRLLLSENLEDVVGLERLTNSLLKMSRLDDVQPTLVQVAIEPLIKTSIKRIEPLAKQKQIALSTKMTSLLVKGDPIALTELWTIFLDNAIKYSLEGSTITVTAVKSGTSARVTFTDQGVGIAKKDLPHIFDRFYQADSARTGSGSRGYGLGLSVAQKIVTQHQGTIAVKSVVGKGSTFTVVLPLV